MLQTLSLILLLVMPLAQAETFSVGEPNVTWTKRRVHVCWNSVGEKSDFKRRQKRAVQNIVEQEYTEEKTSITFYGWEECSALPAGSYDIPIYQDTMFTPVNSTIAIFREAKLEGVASLGEGGSEQLNGYFDRHLEKSYIYLMYNPMFGAMSHTVSATEELQLTALHEFGHAAGLRHEHIRPEAKTDPHCMSLKSPLPVEEMNQTTKTVGDYDSHSIMNYCWLSAIAHTGKSIPDFKIGLSAQDVSTLKQLYP